MLILSCVIIFSAVSRILMENAIGELVLSLWNCFLCVFVVLSWLLCCWFVALSICSIVDLLCSLYPGVLLWWMHCVALLWMWEWPLHAIVWLTAIYCGISPSLLWCFFVLPTQVWLHFNTVLFVGLLHKKYCMLPIIILALVPLLNQHLSLKLVYLLLWHFIVYNQH